MRLSNEISAASEDLRRLSAIVISLQKDAQEPRATVSRRGHRYRRQRSANRSALRYSERDVALGLWPEPVSISNTDWGCSWSALDSGFAAGTYSHRAPAPLQETSEAVNIDAVVERIINVESSGDPNARNKRSSAMGLGQFVDETWLILIRAHRPDLAKGRSEGETLELRRDPIVAREITSRFTERNANILRKRGLPVTPGTLYLAHFAGAAGAIAILSALEGADAASIMASADATGRTQREKLVRANPFLESFSVADLKSWADRKMRIRRS